MYIPTKLDTMKYKKDFPMEYEIIREKYSPIFDMWVAIDMYLNDIPPPTCMDCGCRVTVNKRMGSRCGDCNNSKDKLTYDQFTKHKQSRYEYEPWEGIKSTDDVITFICKDHGSITQIMKSHIKGHGCQKCHFDVIGEYVSNDLAYFLEKSKAAHGDTYDYSKSVYTGAENKILITCRAHGDFEQRANVHYNGHNCPKCMDEKNKITLSYDTDEYISASIAKHGSKYDYSKTIYTGIREKVVITCPEHGDFEQVAYYHTAGNGCQKCGLEISPIMAKSKAEYEIIDFIKLHYDGSLMHTYRKIENTELDIYLPDINLAIEYDGIYWHSSGEINTDRMFKNKHVDKSNMCIRHGIQLLHIFENEWNEKTDIWKSMILQKLGKSVKIPARKCEVKIIQNTNAKEFCNANHLQGHVPCGHAYGLFHNGELVSVLTIGRARYSNYDFEILRFCSLLGHVVVGGFSKLLAHIEERGTIVSYANRRWSNGNVYEQNGFTKIKESDPCHFYIKGSKLLHRSSFMKHKLEKKLQLFDESKSGAQNMYDNKYRRIWDCGNIIYVKEINDA